jgi:hypothetical protein
MADAGRGDALRIGISKTTEMAEAARWSIESKKAKIVPVVTTRLFIIYHFWGRGTSSVLFFSFALCQAHERPRE